VLFLHDTAFEPGDVDLDAPGAPAEVHRRLASTSHATFGSPTTSPQH
jgi:hypothetical protein